MADRKAPQTNIEYYFDRMKSSEEATKITHSGDVRIQDDEQFAGEDGVMDWGETPP